MLTCSQPDSESIYYRQLHRGQPSSCVADKGTVDRKETVQRNPLRNISLSVVIPLFKQITAPHRDVFQFDNDILLQWFHHPSLDRNWLLTHPRFESQCDLQVAAFVLPLAGTKEVSGENPEDKYNLWH